MSFPEPNTGSVYVPGPPDHLGHPSTWPTSPAPQQPAWPTDPPPRRKSRAPLIAVAAIAVVALMAGTGVAVWWVTRPAGENSKTPGVDPIMLVAGVIRLELGQFTWESVSNPVCQGWRGFDDIRAGAQVTVTGSDGKVLAVGALDPGEAEGITTESDGSHRASSCMLPFRVQGVPRGKGPYGVEVTHRGVVHFTEGSAATIRLGFD